MAELPDPTIDLDWSGYVGSIQEHFRAQAEAHPDGTCVVETKSSTTPERRFTYRQIYEAANTLAWYLHNAGVANGDVVMIWAHRSVDLVVALMGILVWRFLGLVICLLALTSDLLLFCRLLARP
jgi:L-aminoadipate-semialdehyde dehydrogenase